MQMSKKFNVILLILSLTKNCLCISSNRYNLFHAKCLGTLDVYNSSVSMWNVTQCTPSSGFNPVVSLTVSVSPTSRSRRATKIACNQPVLTTLGVPVKWRHNRVMSQTLKNWFAFFFKWPKCFTTGSSFKVFVARV